MPEHRLQVLQHEKFSVGSDIWAYGVTVWEIFAAGGSEPFGDLGLGEVGPHVKSGGKLAIPPGGCCPALVYDDLLFPCWMMNVAARPRFGELYDVAIRHGGLEDAISIAKRSTERACVAPPNDTSEVDRDLLGPSVHHLKAVLLPKALAAIQTITNHPNQSRFDSLGLGGAAHANIWHAVHAYAMPVSKHTICPREGSMGCAYVDTLSHENDVGRADALLSYSWSYLVTEVSAALSAWTERRGCDPKQTRIWICSLCLNQHRMADASVAKDLQTEFGDRVVAIGLILPMLEQWDDPGYVKRAW